MKKMLLILSVLLLFVGCSSTKDKIDEKLNDKTQVALAENEVAVQFGEEPFILNGTLAFPQGEGAFPAVILVPSFGPADRDLTIFENKIFKNISDDLTAKGIAVLRYDKNRYTYEENTKKLIAEEKFSIYDEVINDAVYGLEFLQLKDRIDRDNIFVLAYGLGGNQAPRILSKSEINVKGLILMGAYVSPLQDLMLEQYDYLIHLDGKVDAREQEVYDKAKAFSVQVMEDSFNEESILDTIGSLGMPYNYWIDLIKYNPTIELKTMSLPILVLQGERDYEVSMYEFSLWQKSLNQAKFISYPYLNHLFIAGTGDSTPEEYQTKGKVDNEVTTDIANFILKN